MVGVEVLGQRLKPGRKIKHGVGETACAVVVAVRVDVTDGVEVIVPVAVGEPTVGVCVTVGVSVAVLVFAGINVGVELSGQRLKPGRKIKHGVGDSVTVGVRVLVTSGVFVIVGVTDAVLVMVGV